jgi:hypothetical protein
MLSKQILFSPEQKKSMISLKLNKVNPTPKMVYFGLNKMNAPEKMQQITHFRISNKTPDNIFNKINQPSSKTVNKMIQHKNYYGFDKYNKNLNQYTNVNIGSNPTQAGILQSGVLSTDQNKDKLVQQYMNKVEQTNKEQQKQVENEMKEQEKQETVKQDVLLSYLTR